MSTKTQIKTALTKPKFKAWLASQNPRAMAGECGDPNKCAIAAYLADTVLDAGEMVSVDQGAIEVSTLEEDGDIKNQYDYEYSHEVKTPKWACNFIEAFDKGDKKKRSFGTTLKLLESL